jgi:hypothetical protein
MTIWILALVLFAGSAAAGYNRGAIRVSISMLGLLVASLLSLPLSPAVRPLVKGLLGMFSVTNPIVIQSLAPAVAFTILLIICKVAAYALHHQAEVYYKYKAGDLRLALWMRMNSRLGACLGLVNATIYLLLILLPFYLASFWTAQLGTEGSDPKSVALVNRVGKDLHATGMDKAMRALDPLPDSYYTASDIVGVLYHNPLAQSRLAHYPGLLGFSERQEFQDIANDKDFIEMTQRQAPIGEILQSPKIQAIINNPDLLKQIWATLTPDLKDLRDFMNTGKSAKYDGEMILGRWTFDANASAAELRRARPNMSVTDMKKFRALLMFAFKNASLMATPEHKAYIKGVVWIKPGAKDNPTEAANRSGEWAGDSSGYTASVEGKDYKLTPVGEKLKMTGEWSPLVFSKEE